VGVGKQKSADVKRKTVTLIYPDPFITIIMVKMLVTMTALVTTVLALAILGDMTQNGTNTACVMPPKEAKASRVVMSQHDIALTNFANVKKP
jgi:hypothetical protein